jgi:citronellol/citronellal dehydrogenase
MVLKNKVIIITGSTRGIGRAMALRFAREKARIVIVGKTIKEHEKLPGTIHSVAEEVAHLGGEPLPICADVREVQQLKNVVDKTVKSFGKIDICINNASALCLLDTEEIPVKKLDLIHAVNYRATFIMSKLCLPHLRRSSMPNILIISPPINLDPIWFKDHLGYTISKYSMSLCTFGMSAEFADYGVRVNSLWPKTIIATSAIKFNFPQTAFKASRKPDIMADAAYAIFTQFKTSGNFYIDEDVLRDTGVRDFSHYSQSPNVTELYPDLYL